MKKPYNREDYICFKTKEINRLDAELLRRDAIINTILGVLAQPGFSKSDVSKLIMQYRKK